MKTPARPDPASPPVAPAAAPRGGWATTGRWWQRLVNAGAAIWLIWQTAPLWVLDGSRPFDLPLARLGLLVGLGLLAWALHAGWSWHAARRNARLLESLQAGSQATDALLQQRFAQAMAVLRQGVPQTPASTQTGQPRRASVGWPGWGRRRHVDVLPWYLFIGAPGAGKTTALLNAGLQFPLAATTGRAPLAGIGGTRHCDWWFTEQAVFIDTAGRYTTQDSDRRADAGEWRSFLGLLRRHRPAQPINGVIVTVSVPDLLAGGAVLREQAAAVAARLQELREQLQQRFPVYLLVTKTDLLAGFDEFFARFDAAAREQVWGIGYRIDPDPPRPGRSGAVMPSTPNMPAIPADHPPAFEPAETAAHLRALAGRLQQLTPTRLQQEAQPQRRIAIYHFAAQLEALAEPLQDFVGSALRHCGTAPQQAVRGIYLSSGTQEGNPIDRVLGALTRGVGVALRALPRPDGAGKAYFLARLLREGVVGEAALAGSNLHRQRLRRRLEQAGVASLMLLLLSACALWGWSSRNNQLYLQGVRERVEQIGQRIQGRPGPAGGGIGGDQAGGDNAQPQIDRLLPLYAILRDLASSGGIDPAAPPAGLNWGLFQGPQLAQSAAQTYHHVLDLSLAPLLAQRLSAVLADDAAPLAARYEALRVHAMLKQPGHLRREEVRAWADRAFAIGVSAGVSAGDASGSGVSAGERQEWLQHLDALLERNAVLEVVRVDEAALRNAAAAVQREPLARRAYERLLASARQRVLAEPELARAPVAAGTLAGLAGTDDAALRFGARKPGLALPDIPAHFSAPGWQRLVQLALLDSVTQTVDEQAWVFGGNSPAGTSGGSRAGSGIDSGSRDDSDAASVDRATLARQVLRLYAQDYIAHWDRLFDRLGLEPMADEPGAPSAASRLAAPDSPLRRLLAALGRELQPGSRSRAGAATVAVAAAGGPPAPGPGEDDIRAEWNDELDSALNTHFAPLLAQLQGRSPDSVDRLLEPIAAAGAGGVGSDPAQAARLRLAARTAAAPLATFWSQLAEQLERRQAQRVSAELGEALGELGRACAAITADRYPFVRGGRSEVSLVEFSRLLGPQGLLDRFFRERLAGLVDTRQQPWRLTAGGPAGAVAPSAAQARALQSFEQAQQLRALFFASGGPAPQLRLKVVPVELDPALFWLSLDVDGQPLRYENGPRRARLLTWPTAGPSGKVLLRIPRPDTADTATEIHEGTWALWRVLTQQAWSRPAPGVARVRVSHSGLGLGLVLDLNAEASAGMAAGATADRPVDPWPLGQLDQFRCPTAW